jgi:hypothetical protein
MVLLVVWAPARHFSAKSKILHIQRDPARKFCHPGGLSR